MIGTWHTIRYRHVIDFAMWHDCMIGDCALTENAYLKPRLMPLLSPPFTALTLSLSGSMILFILRAKEQEVLTTSVSASPGHQVSPEGLLTVLTRHSFAGRQEVVGSPPHRLIRLGRSSDPLTALSFASLPAPAHDLDNIVGFIHILLLLFLFVIVDGTAFVV